MLVLILTENENLCFAVAERISLSLLADAMRPSFDVVMQLVTLLFPLIRRFDGVSVFAAVILFNPSYPCPDP